MQLFGKLFIGITCYYEPTNLHQDISVGVSKLTPLICYQLLTRQP